MHADLRPAGRVLLIGSQPLHDHQEALRLTLDHAPEIPNWVQLPVFPQEGMVAQFMSGLPGLAHREGRDLVDTRAEGFDAALAAFYEQYLALSEGGGDWEDSCFALRPETAGGFFALLAALTHQPRPLWAVKGQITGPITFTTAMKDQSGRAIIHDETLRDAAVKLMALKAAWQVRTLSRLGVPVILFIDEPALAGYGSSELISISREVINDTLGEVMAAVHGQGGLAGVHVCANTDWSLLLDSAVDIVNFDAHGYFDRFILYAKELRRFLLSGRCLAWGLVPTLRPEDIAAATPDALWQAWQAKSAQVSALGIDPEVVRRQAFISPSCGTGSLTPELSRRVLALTRDLSRRLRSA